MPFFRILDLLLAAVALPVFLAAGLPVAGWAAGAGAWALQRGIHHWTDRRAVATDDLRTKMAYIMGSMIGRGWLVAIAILLVGLLAGPASGLSAGVLFLVLFTVFLLAQLMLRSLSRLPEGLQSR